MQESLVTDEARALIGKETYITKEVTKDDIRKFAVAVGDLNPLYLDEESARRSRYGGVIAHPMQYKVTISPIVPESELTPGGWPEYRYLPMKVSERVFGGAETEFFTPIRPGDIITAKRKLVDISEKESSKGGLIALVTFEVTCTNQKEEVVVVTRETSVWLGRRVTSREGQRAYEPMESEGTAPRIAPRGSTFKDVEVGMKIPSLVKRPTMISQFMFSAAIWDTAPHHYDRQYARSLGHKDVLVVGAQQVSWAVQMITDWLGENGTLRKMSWRHHAPAHPGDVLTCTGTIKGKRAEADKGYFDLDFFIENQSKQRVTSGAATAYVPIRCV